MVLLFPKYPPPEQTSEHGLAAAGLLGFSAFLRARETLPGQLTRTTGPQAAPWLADAVAVLNPHSYPIPVLRSAGQSHRRQHDWLPRAEFGTARLARYIAAALQVRSHPS